MAPGGQGPGPGTQVPKSGLQDPAGSPSAARDPGPGARHLSSGSGVPKPVWTVPRTKTKCLLAKRGHGNAHKSSWPGVAM
jgi:hypothetical protein